MGKLRIYNCVYAKRFSTHFEVLSIKLLFLKGDVANFFSDIFFGKFKNRSFAEHFYSTSIAGREQKYLGYLF